MKTQLLLVEDDSALAGSLADFLQESEFEVDFAYNGESGLNLLADNHYDLIIMDISMPKMDGITACEKLRALNIETPVLFLTARDTLDDRLKAFQAGADDYLQKPFSPEELVFRIHAILRRGIPQTYSQKELGPLVLDFNLMQVKHESGSIILPEIQFRILKILAHHAPNPVSRTQLATELWQDHTPESDPLRTHIYRLRQALDKLQETPLIHSVYGKGYRLAIPE